MSGTRDQGNILGTMPVDRLVLTMSAPIMVSMLVSAVYNLVDSIYVAQVSDLDFLALSYAYPVQLMMVAFCTGIGVGFNATFAQRLGEGKGEEANRVACHGFLFIPCAGCCFWPLPCLEPPCFSGCPPTTRWWPGGGGVPHHLLRGVHRHVHAVFDRAAAPDHRAPRGLYDRPGLRGGAEHRPWTRCSSSAWTWGWPGRRWPR